MVKRGGVVVIVLALAVVSLAVYEWHISGQPPMGLEMGAVKAAGSTEPVPWIDLERLKVDRPKLPLGRRDIFQWVPRPVPIPVTPVPVEQTVDPATLTPTPTAPPPPLPPLPLKFIGMFQEKGKPKIAVLMSEQKEIMPGHEGDLLAGRYRIVKIGLESVDVEDVTTGQKQTIALRGN
jgi:hypothetical protein